MIIVAILEDVKSHSNRTLHQRSNSDRNFRLAIWESPIVTYTSMQVTCELTFVLNHISQLCVWTKTWYWRLLAWSWPSNAIVDSNYMRNYLGPLVSTCRFKDCIVHSRSEILIYLTACFITTWCMSPANRIVKSVRWLAQRVGMTDWTSRWGVLGQGKNAVQKSRVLPLKPFSLLQLRSNDHLDVFT